MNAPVLRLIADDLTGALDTAAALTGLCGPVPVAWDAAAGAGSGSLALDTGTREIGREAAIARLRAVAAPVLDGAGIAYKKIDSLLRGHVAAELAACVTAGDWAHCVVAPAFPAQGRITRDGQVMARQPDGTWSPVRPDLLAALHAEGLRATRGRQDTVLPPGIAVFDAESDAELARIAGLGRTARGPVLWCGSGGLAHALAGDAAARTSTRLRWPVLGLFGSDQAVTARQLAACDACRIRVAGGGAAEASRIATMMGGIGAALVSIEVPAGMDRAAAARRIEAVMTGLTQRLPRPGTLIVAGGETLRAICRGLGVQSLEATGLVAPGVPRSVMRGGAWGGVEVVSKSGAFGGDTLWRDLLAGNGLPLTGSFEA